MPGNGDGIGHLHPFRQQYVYLIALTVSIFSSVNGASTVA